MLQQNEISAILTSILLKEMKSLLEIHLILISIEQLIARFMSSARKILLQKVVLFEQAILKAM
jgi:hypothetical protein